MVQDELKIDLLCREKRELRDEILEMQKSMHKVVFSFVTVAIAVIGVYYGDFFLQSSSYKDYFIFILIQVEFVFSLFLTSLIAHQSVSAGYIAVIEQKINYLCNEQLLIYESKIVKEYIFGTKGPFFYTTLLIVLFVFCIFVFLLFVGISIVKSYLISTILVIEVMSILLLLAWAFRNSQQVIKTAQELMKTTK